MILGSSTGGDGFSAIYDELATYSEPLTAAETLSHYQQGVTGLTNTVPPTVSGALNVGGTLTVSPGTWSPTPTSFNYFWHRADNASGLNLVEIGATGSTYTLSSSDVAKYIHAGVIPVP